VVHQKGGSIGGVAAHGRAVGVDHRLHGTSDFLTRHVGAWRPLTGGQRNITDVGVAAVGAQNAMHWNAFGRPPVISDIWR